MTTNATPFELIKLDAEATSCPVCDDGLTAWLYEERVPLKTAGAPMGHAGAYAALRMRVCSQCTLEFAGAEESRFNQQQVLATRETYGTVEFVRTQNFGKAP